MMSLSDKGNGNMRLPLEYCDVTDYPDLLLCDEGHRTFRSRDFPHSITQRAQICVTLRANHISPFPF